MSIAAIMRLIWDRLRRLPELTSKRMVWVFNYDHPKAIFVINSGTLF